LTSHKEEDDTIRTKIGARRTLENIQIPTQRAAGIPRIYFGPYEIDPEKGDVRKHGIRIKLARQPLEILLLLVERKGEIVSREEIRQRLWSEDVFVDFERSLNSAVKKLRAALNDSPDAPRYIETLPRQGYRFIGLIETTSDPTEFVPQPITGHIDALQPPSEPLPAATVPSRKFHVSRWAWGAVALMLLTAFLFFAFGRFKTVVKGGSQIPKGPNVRSSVAILGFKNLSSQHGSDWLGGAIAQMVATEMQEQGKLRIVPEEAVAKAKKTLELKEKEGYPRDVLRDLEKQLDNDYVIAGSFIALGNKESGQVRLDMRLQESVSGETLASVAASGRQSEIFGLVKSAAQEMISKVSGTIGPEGDADWRTALPASAEASRLYSDGLARLRAGENVAARKSLEQSLALDPQFVLAESALAQAWQALGGDDRARTTAEKARSSDAALPENVRLKVEGQYFETEHDWDGAITVYRHLLRDYPDDLDVGLKKLENEVYAGRLQEARATIASLRSLGTNFPSDPRIELAEALVASRNADFQAQQQFSQAAAKKAQQSRTPLLLARAKLIEGWALDDQSRSDDALAAYRAAQPIFEKAEESDSAATVLDDIGIILEKKGDSEGARASMEQAQHLFRQIGDENGLAAALTNLGELSHSQGELSRAEELYREALQIFQKNARRDNEIAALNNLGGVLFERGRFVEAKEAFQNILQLSQGDKSAVAHSKINLAALLWVQGDLDQSTTMLEDALRTFREVGDRSGMANADVAYSRVLLVKKDFPAARSALQDAMNVSHDITTKADTAQVQILLAEIALSEGQPQKTDMGAIDSAIADLRAERRQGDVTEGLATEIEILLATGKVDQAEQTLQQAQSVRNATWLSNYKLSLASAKIDAARGNRGLSRRKLASAKAKALKAGCGTCLQEL
jgi:eukaryotic-like serine/threonine-protein kinase